jgi:hypothetical protein
MPDSELLLKRLKETPDDEALLSALSDCWMEEGDHRAGLALELLEEQRKERLTGSKRPTVDILRYQLGLTDIQVNDFLYYDKGGRVYPVRRYHPESAHHIGIAMKEPNEKGIVRVYLTGDWGSYFRECNIQAAPRDTMRGNGDGNCFIISPPTKSPDQ